MRAPSDIRRGGVKCPKCRSSKTRVIDSRQRAAERIRRRQCGKCDKRFTTTEIVGRPVVGETPLLAPAVQKKNGKLQPFSRDKLRRSIMAAVRQKSGARVLPVDEIVDGIESELTALSDAEDAAVATARIGEMALARMREADEMAFLRYASVHRELQSPRDLAALVEELEAAAAKPHPAVEKKPPRPTAEKKQHPAAAKKQRPAAAKKPRPARKKAAA